MVCFLSCFGIDLSENRLKATVMTNLGSCANSFEHFPLGSGELLKELSRAVWSNFALQQEFNHIFCRLLNGKIHCCFTPYSAAPGFVHQGALILSMLSHSSWMLTDSRDGRCSTCMQNTQRDKRPYVHRLSGSVGISRKPCMFSGSSN